MPITTLPPSPYGSPTFTHDDARLKINEVVDNSNLIDMDDGHLVRVDEDSGLLSLFHKVEGVDVFIGAWGGGLTDQYVFDKAAGGLRFTHSDGSQYFAIHRSLLGGSRGAIFGNLDSGPDGNFIATEDSGGVPIYHKTSAVIFQEIGNQASTNFIEDTFFTWQVTSDQVLPYASQLRRFECTTDVGFTDVPFDVRILDENGVELFSDIQNLEVWEEEPQPPGDPTFVLSSVGGVAGRVNMPMSQPLVVDSGTTITVEYRFKTAVRLKGDGTLPAMRVRSRRIEFYPVDYTREVPFMTADFVAETGVEYRVDTSGGTVVATLHPTVRSIWVGDFETTWTNITGEFHIDYGGVSPIVFGTPEKGQRFQIVQSNGTFRIYNPDGSLHSVVP